MGTVDGPGIRYVIFMQGCRYRCVFCHNPDTFDMKGGKYFLSAGEVFKRISELKDFYKKGGVTVSGGEPLLQSEFIRQFRQLCGPEWRITVETSLNVPQQNVEELISIIDNYIIDIKDMNNNIYQRYTGKNNENVLGNLRYLIGKDKAKQIVIRTPLIPSYNTEKDIDQSIELLKEMGITQFDRFTYKTPND